MVFYLGASLVKSTLVENEHGWWDQLAETHVPGTVGVPAGQGSQDSASCGISDLRALTDGEVTESLCHNLLARQPDTALAIQATSYTATMSSLEVSCSLRRHAETATIPIA